MTKELFDYLITQEPNKQVENPFLQQTTGFVSVDWEKMLFYKTSLKHDLIVVEVSSHHTLTNWFNHTTPFLSTKGLEKSLCKFTSFSSVCEPSLHLEHLSVRVR